MKGIVMVTQYFMNRHIHLLAVLAVVAALLLVGCGGSSSAPASSPSPTAASTSTSTSATTTTNATATLKHQPQGMATISWDPASQGLTVKISLTGLAPNSKHPAHIHSGSCAKQGAVVYPLTDVVADAHGVGSSTTTIKSVANLSPSGWYLNIHNGPNLTPSDQFLPIACTDLTFSNVSATSSLSVQVPLNAAPGSSEDQSASGMAQLTLSGGTLMVKLTLSGLAPNSKHAAHIHSGSCESQGAVVYALPPVAADASGNASETATFPNVSSIPSSGWYVNVHHSTDLSTQTGFDPIACGNVIVS
jgi:Cu/Zn superoxide dismutase